MNGKQKYFDKRCANADKNLLCLSEKMKSFYQGNPHYKRFLRDERKAAEFLRANKIEGSQILQRMAPRCGGSFYRRCGGAYALDTAAKLYPLVMGRYASSVFRLSAWLKEDVAPELLQCALNRIMPRFPFFCVLIKKGLFWHYADAYNGRCEVRQETDIPCRQIPLSGRRSVPFRMVYRGKRIGVEFFHALTDGTGGMVFLKTLIGEYLRLKGVDFLYGDGVLDPAQTCRKEEHEDGFLAVRSALPPGGMEESTALAVRGKLSFRRARVHHFVCDAEKLKERAHLLGVTVTAFLTGGILRASRECTEGNGMLRIQIPVNVRKFYGLETLTNCAMFACVSFARKDVSDDDAFYAKINDQLKQKTGKECTERAIVKARGLVRKLGCVPLIFKRPAARAYNAAITKRSFTQTFSNLGVIRLPQGLAEHVEMFDFVIGSPSKNAGYLSSVTYGGKAVISYTTSNENNAFEELFYKFLTDEGLCIEVLGGQNYAD